MLYNGFTKEGRGRYQYLQARTFKKPEEKYEYPLTTSWEYGWRLDDVVKEFRAPQFGRSRIVRDTFFRRNGILYEPITAWCESTDIWEIFWKAQHFVDGNIWLFFIAMTSVFS